MNNLLLVLPRAQPGVGWEYFACLCEDTKFSRVAMNAAGNLCTIARVDPMAVAVSNVAVRAHRLKAPDPNGAHFRLAHALSARVWMDLCPIPAAAETDEDEKRMFSGSFDPRDESAWGETWRDVSVGVIAVPLAGWAELPLVGADAKHWDAVPDSWKILTIDGSTLSGGFMFHPKGTAAAVTAPCGARLQWLSLWLAVSVRRQLQHARTDHDGL
jgi:hypothetical protein